MKKLPPRVTELIPEDEEYATADGDYLFNPEHPLRRFDRFIGWMFLLPVIGVAVVGVPAVVIAVPLETHGLAWLAALLGTAGAILVMLWTFGRVSHASLNPWRILSRLIPGFVLQAAALIIAFQIDLGLLLVVVILVAAVLPATTILVINRTTRLPKSNTPSQARNK